MLQFAVHFKISLHILQIDFALDGTSGYQLERRLLFFEHPKKSKVNMKKMPTNQEEEKG